MFLLTNQYNARVCRALEVACHEKNCRVGSKLGLILKHEENNCQSSCILYYEVGGSSHIQVFRVEYPGVGGSSARGNGVVTVPSAGEKGLTSPPDSSDK